jgi:uncharacterized protein YbjT (DUF2867 family)
VAELRAWSAQLACSVRYSWFAVVAVRGEGAHDRVGVAVLECGWAFERRRARHPSSYARVVATVLTDPGPYVGRVFELTGPRSQDMNGVAEEYARALSRPVSYVDVPWETWAEQVLARAGLGPYVDEHLETMARLHRENRYDRMTATVEEITGQPAESVQAFVARRGDLFAD